MTTTTLNPAQITRNIQAALTAKFIKTEELARAIALAVVSGKNLLLWGPGGHGKSEMVEEALKAILANYEGEVFVQSFGEGMDEATLWGGLDFMKLENEKVLEYHPEHSFLGRPYAVFEELFDAPAVVLLALKDTLTSGWLRKGHQKYQKKTRVIIALTNKDPSEISELGPAAHALIERFPIQLKVAWPSYKPADYLELFQKVGPRLAGADLNGMTAVLADLMAKIGEKGSPISPRSAVHALGVVKTAAAIRGSERVEKVDLLDLRFIDGMEGLTEDLQKELDAAAERAQAEVQMIAAEQELSGLLGAFEAARIGASPLKLLQSAKHLAAFQDKASALKATEGLVDRRKRLRDTAAEKASEAQRLALDYTRV